MRTVDIAARCAGRWRRARSARVGTAAGVLLAWWSLAALPPPACARAAPRKPSEIVVLTVSGSTCPLGFVINRQVLPDGTIAPFAIPDGQVLVLTGVNYVWLGGPANRLQGIDLTLKNNGERVFSHWVMSDFLGNFSDAQVLPN